MLALRMARVTMRLPCGFLVASADMKQRFGAKPARSCLRLTAWIAANHTIEGVVGSITKQRPNANEKSGEIEEMGWLPASLSPPPLRRYFVTFYRRIAGTGALEDF
jgi:hypothetical protein